MERRNWLTRRDTLAGLERQHDDKDALSNWRSPTRPGQGRRIEQRSANKK